ncbi:hypothetical protein RN001_001999 [Aquatica leii]|uniref:Uncharacterized protein n=1 Tax=Aquatica leii TaxID=1421715 RepID=A0AAN7PGS3_9COLE|nr:hypothetical protein RN001_001999 [Aquatica leii]
MTVSIKCFLLIDFIIVNFYYGQSSIVPHENLHKCIPDRADYHVLEEFPKLEIVNRFNERPLKDLLPPRDIIPEGNQMHNQYMRCVWKNERLMYRNDDVNYHKLEELITKAIVSVVGNTGPSIQLSSVYAKEIVDGCKSIGGDPGTKIIRMQNYIIASETCHCGPYVKWKPADHGMFLVPSEYMYLYVYLKILKLKPPYCKNRK